ncbi:unnamed protein product [Dibothriocephalus latus]|uniref:Rad21/Rec8-like protein C-terminal eukaryotic domain-containing protein n=1 Tax=Dibothriocephalus latus TaxID=60516 RepID=A0A3P7PXH4_DIBLA|nr:unnamed protein product [Dibothriocephalus latus]
MSPSIWRYNPPGGVEAEGSSRLLDSVPQDVEVVFGPPVSVTREEHAWNFPDPLIVTFGEVLRAASKFYTVLLLRKQGAVELVQEGPYADIRLFRGPTFGGVPSEA